jgi:hypothetical protein
MMPIISEDATIFQFAVYGCRSLKQERLFRIPADTIGQHYNRILGSAHPKTTVFG